LIAVGAMSVPARLPLGHDCDGRQKARVSRADELPRAGDGEEEEDDEEHAPVADGAHIAGGSVQLYAVGQLHAPLRPVPGMTATSAMTRVLMSAEKAAPAFT
jgi:hypothetical protein